MIFSGGPAQQNRQVLDQLCKWIQKDPSILEVSHRSDEFQYLLSICRKTLRELLDVPDEMEILFLSGGASFQFLMIAENLLKKKAGYLITGLFSRLAYDAAIAYGRCDVLYDASNHPYDLSDFPKEISGDYDYVHVCVNNSIYGTRTPDFTCDCPVIADVSSVLGIEKIDFSRYALCYASTQKNFGLSGMSLVFVRKDLNFKVNLNPLISYKKQIECDSLVNTPPVLSIVMVYLVASELLKRKELMYLENQQKADLFYKFLDQQEIFMPLVKKNRSWMNCTFKMNSNEDEQKFLELCEKHRIIGIKGHKTTGHFRASFSVHNTLDQVNNLIQFMDSCLHHFKSNE